MFYDTHSLGDRVLDDLLFSEVPGFDEVLLDTDVLVMMVAGSLLD
jgi:hypothetical protein